MEGGGGGWRGVGGGGGVGGGCDSHGKSRLSPRLCNFRNPSLRYPQVKFKKYPMLCCSLILMSPSPILHVRNLRNCNDGLSNSRSRAML